jgi:hypothetical protein
MSTVVEWLMIVVKVVMAAATTIEQLFIRASCPL